MNEKRIVVVGGGAAGAIAAIRASELRQDVTLIEKNPILGKKLLLSGKGRCNLTNACDLDSFIKRFSGNGQFLRDAFKKFFNLDLMRFFEERGLKLKTERQLRVFPETDRSVSIVQVLEKELHKNKVKIIYKAVMQDILMQDSEIKGLLLRDGKVIPADRLILATGGISYGFTGSTGEGLGMAKRLGHSIVSLRPGLVPLVTRQHYPKLLEGLVLKNIRLRFSDSKKHIESEIGELLFTGFGISGPLVLSLSGKIVDWLKDTNFVYVELDLKPALTKEQLRQRLLREFKLNPKKTIKNVLKSLLPKRLVDVFIDIVKIPPDKKVSHITQKEREGLVNLLKGMRLDIVKALPIEEAMVTRGGVSLKDINPRTMESRLIKGLYFAGEIMDIDADTGGFNLQAAFSTGYLAGESAALN
ncbi:MAG: NAD(P)/FAD-dependent oxidoreductase [Candidatus Omnitrophica bacterium]|nr:NAD(P)/FAD-dependent oxidoreductase [Candidatus Omnitrophota bacterium]